MLDRLAKLWRGHLISGACILLMALSLTGCRLTERLAKKDEVPNGNVSHPITGPELDKNGSAAQEQPTGQPREKPAPTAASAAGTYHYKTYRPGEEGYDNTLKVEAKRGGKLAISLFGCYTHRANGEETIDADGGNEMGEATLRGNKATASVSPENGGDLCHVVITFDGDKAEVKAEKACKFNVVLDGTYTKENGGDQTTAGSDVIVTSDPAVVVGAIYRDFFANGENGRSTFERHRAQFSPELRALWEADERESAALEGITGFDADPLTAMSDNAPGCSIGTATREGNDALVPVTVGPVSIRVRLTRSNDTWLITNFDQDGSGEFHLRRKSGYEVHVSLRVANSKVQEILYTEWTPINRSGHECGVDASRGDSESKWIEQGDKTTVSYGDAGVDDITVTVTKRADGFLVQSSCNDLKILFVKQRGKYVGRILRL